jgi:hypothetical protein
MQEPRWRVTLEFELNQVIDVDNATKIALATGFPTQIDFAVHRLTLTMTIDDDTVHSQVGATRHANLIAKRAIAETFGVDQRGLPGYIRHQTQLVNN